MEKREISGCKFDGDFSSLLFEDNLHDEEHLPHPQSNQDRQHVSKNNMTPQKHCRLAAVSLSVLAAVLLIVDISLGVHYTSLTRNDTEDIGKELAKLQLTYTAAVGAIEVAKKQLDSEMSRQRPTNWELEHQTKRIKEYEAQLVENKKNIAAMRDNFLLINAGCTHCTPDWILINSMCYYFQLDNTGRSWKNAREYCQVHGGDLAVLDSKDKENATVNFLLNRQQFLNIYMNMWFWIGLRKFTKEGIWKWVDGRTLVEGYWDTGEPNYNYENNCGTVTAKENFFKAWNNYRCDNNKKWICEKAPISSS